MFTTAVNDHCLFVTHSLRYHKSKTAQNFTQQHGKLCQIEYSNNLNVYRASKVKLALLSKTHAC